LSTNLYSDAPAALLEPARKQSPLNASGILRWRTLLVCTGLWMLLAGWAILWPQSGDGDAIMHFINARDGLWKPALLLGSWARVGSKLHLLIPAQFGLLPTRWMSALVSAAVAWQTVRMAEDLKIRRAILAAPLLIFQPLVFALAGDTMTELTMSLGLVIAIRLWWAERWILSCLVMSYVPLIRPEGFFLCAMWAVMTLLTSRIGPIPRRFATGVSLIAGCVAWSIACWILWKDPFYFVRPSEGWTWQANSIKSYGNGSFFSQFGRWPQYCGPMLFALFVAGVAPAFRWKSLRIYGIAVVLGAIVLPSFLRENVLPWLTFPLLIAMALAWRRDKLFLPWLAFLLVLTLHSILWWKGWFGSCGLMRILGCVSPVTALICLRGWNAAADRFPQRAAAIAAMLLITVTPAIYYAEDSMHYRVFPLHQACDYVRARNLLAGCPKIILGDPMAAADLNLPPNTPNLMMHECDRLAESKLFLETPVGAVGLWDNQHAQEWFGVRIEDLPALGFDILYDAHHTVICNLAILVGGSRSDANQGYVVIRKVREGRLPADLLK
jgi:hypothetical protein